jgi:starch phosphorylase
VHEIPAGELWAAHIRLKRRLVEFVAASTEGVRTLDFETLTIGFSRRFAPYKRANLVLADRKRLEKLLADSKRPIQFVFSGKAHPADGPGKDILRQIVLTARERPQVVFLEDYDIEVARYIVQGADIWLNNPRRFLEASGTSGMKAGANGVLNSSARLNRSTTTATPMASPKAG